MSVHGFIFMSCHDNGHDQVMTLLSRMVTNNYRNDGVALSRIVMGCYEVVMSGHDFS